MSDSPFETMKAYLSFSETDQEALASLRATLKPYFPQIITEFYDAVRADPATRRIIEAVEGRQESLYQSLAVWLNELFSGEYDESYYENRCNIGRIHVRVGLAQHYMFVAMNVLRRSLVSIVQDLDLEHESAKISAVHKILDLDLAVMNATYSEDLIRRIKISEHTEYVKRLSESEHLATIGQLAASLAHEIKNPLAGISGAIQVLGAGLDDDHPHKDVITEVLHQIDRLDAAVKDLLIYARPKPPDQIRINLTETLDRAMILFRQEPAFKQVSLKTEGFEKAHYLKADETQIQQVVTNLMLNAAHACEQGGRVLCRIEKGRDNVRVLIQDDGVGIQPDVLPRVFEPFYTTKARGTGLGLNICKRIIEAHAGTLTIQSTVGEGTCVTIELPDEP